ncbi:DUF4279 domain-containing protein [Catellatospora methionotrophica]|uniref:DUF4279 domain-containing protein n=1 Tax=Catellatospora methionotrophica TaxID=121620 RepID=UPI0033D0BB30
MRVNQYVYFALRSEQVSAEQMTAILGIEPDEVGVRGSRQTEPVRPVCHSWKVVCREPFLTVDEQVDRVLARLLPTADRIGALVAGSGEAEESQIASVLEVVRYFEPAEDDESEILLVDRTPEQRNLFGWHLDARVLDFLVRTHAGLDVDEYGG